MIKKQGDYYVLFSHDGSRVLGKFKTKDEALKRERQINFFKRINRSNKGKQK